MNIKKIIIALVIFLLNTGCGYKVIKYNELSNFYVTQIESEGDKTINYKIKNKLKTYNLEKEKNKTNIGIKIISEKKRSIKEKSIDNEVTKYQMDISVKIKTTSNNKDFVREFTINKTAEYSVKKNHSKTLNNQKKILNLLTASLAEEIINKLILEFNDL